ncbi:MAG: hypothetical protein LBV51_01520 [Acholeplasmatales bacterium]|jgi:hypothetical protein|nr:hypothetical protein [Acholeplasmatales bacterium]
MKKLSIMFMFLFIIFMLVGCNKKTDVLLLNEGKYLKNDSKFNLQEYIQRSEYNEYTIFSSYEDIVNTKRYQSYNQNKIKKEIKKNNLLLEIVFMESSADGGTDLISYKLVDNKITFIFTSGYNPHKINTLILHSAYYLVSINTNSILEVSYGIQNKLNKNSGISAFYF